MCRCFEKSFGLSAGSFGIAVVFHEVKLGATVLVMRGPCEYGYSAMHRVALCKDLTEENRTCC